MDPRSALCNDDGKLFTEPYVQNVVREGYLPDRQVEEWVNQSVSASFWDPRIISVAVQGKFEIPSASKGNVCRDGIRLM